MKLIIKTTLADHLELDQRQPFDGTLYYTGPGSLAQWVTGATHTAKE